MRSLDPSLDYVVEECAPGTEYTVDVLVDPGGACRVAVPRRRIEVRAGEVSKGVTVANDALAQVAAAVAERLPGAFGVLNVQIFLDPETGSLAVIEINARFGGGFPLSLHAGAEAPRWLMEVLRVGSSTTSLGWRAGVVMLRYDRAVFAAADDLGVQE